MQLPNNINVFLALLKRDMLLLKSSIKSKVIDGLFMCTIIIMAVGYLLPSLGMPNHMIGPMFINIFFNIFFMFGFSMAINFANEIKNKGRIFYLLTLPTTMWSIVASYIMTFIVEATLIAFPLLGIGIFILQDRIQIEETNILLFACIYITSLIFFGLFMLTISVHYKYNWFLDNIWPRRLSPMFSLGATFFLWKQAYAMMPHFAYIMLANPMLYICEGLRFAFIGGDAFINGWYCLVAIIAFTILFGFIFSYCFKKRLDPVC